MRVLFVLCLVFLLAAGSEELQVRLSLNSVNPPRVGVSFTNANEYEAAGFLNWNTPLEGIFNNIFNVRDVRTNENVDYLGFVVRRGADPLDEEFTLLRPSETVSVIVDLWEYYAIEEGGKYEISFMVPEYIGVCKDVLHLTVPKKAIPSRNNTHGLQAYTNCDDSQINTITSSVKTSAILTKKSFDCLTARSCDALSVRWFGTFSTTNDNYLRTTYNSITNRINNYAFSAYCNPAGCGTNVYGYVYPSDRTFTVYLCNLFWTIPNERVNTIIHEMSHFSSLGGTQDYTYGVTNCLNLAKTNPTRASHNADNICYFSSEIPSTL